MKDMKQIVKKIFVIAMMVITACLFTMWTPETASAATKCSTPKIAKYANNKCNELTIYCSGGGKKANTLFLYMKTAGGSYKNVAAVSTSKGAQKSTVVKSLKASTKYCFKVRAANKYQKKQYFNSKTKKWQNKKPSAKKWKGKKTRKVTAYRWYSKYSSEKIICTASLHEAPKAFPVVSGTKLTYGSTTISLGQSWTSTVCGSLKASGNGYEAVNRPKYAESSVTGKAYDVSVHMFDVNDYSNFLAVYVADGQIVGWITNGPVFGTVNGSSVAWGDRAENYSCGISVGCRTSGSACANTFTDIDAGDTVVGGFDTISHVGTSDLNIESEKRIGLHCINAYRVAAGLQKLSYSDALDGRDYTWSGEANGTEYTDVRYGAQPFVETAYASRITDHYTEDMTSGPLAGVITTDRDMITYLATGIKPRGELISTGGVGEACLNSYMSSNSSTLILLYPRFTLIGIGLCGGFNGSVLAY